MCINVWTRGIFDALDKRDSSRVLTLALIYFPLLAASIFHYGEFTVGQAKLNDHLIDRWLANGRYYQLNLVSGDHENPEFRIADDGRGGRGARNID